MTVFWSLFPLAVCVFVDSLLFHILRGCFFNSLLFSFSILPEKKEKMERDETERKRTVVFSRREKKEGNKRKNREQQMRMERETAS